MILRRTGDLETYPRPLAHYRDLDVQGYQIGAYGGLLAPSRDQRWVASLEPRFVLALARVLDASGDAAAARAEYARFAALWRDADPGLPELTEARQRLQQ